MSVEQNLRRLSEHWTNAAPAERSNAQSYLIQLCEALEVERPRPAGSGYEFEYAVRVVNRDGSESTNFVDLFKRGHFLLEAKDQGSVAADSILLRKAYGQARAYAAAVDGGPPPYLLVLDIGRTLLLWDRWSGSYGGFSAAQVINLVTLAEHSADYELLRDIFERPDGRNPNLRAAAITQETAAQLARLAASLEQRGHEQERVARFLIRCVFTMFAEDIELIHDRPFTRAIEELGFEDPTAFVSALSRLWHAMDEGSDFGLRKLLRFNGHFFAEQEVLPLTREDLAVLHEAALASWSEVEPSIMGTLLTRALDPVERHRLGAEYTPREFVERVVRPTVEEPIRDRWTAVQAEVLQLRDTVGKAARTVRAHDRTALERLREFHAWLRGLRFLDPACGSGNFLYVTLAIVKQIELEVLRAIEEITGAPELAVEEVGPWQFHGIEVKPWAREIAELTLWIGYHQWWRRTHGHTQPPEPVLRDTGTLECRDAVLAWDEIREVPERSRPDPTPRIGDPVTGRMVPDPKARLPYYEYVGARQAEWPEADFIVGNPPYMGVSRQREVFGDGYVEALRGAYPPVPESADYVMYWWHRAAAEVAAGRTQRAGLITTNTITQSQNRAVIARAAEGGAHVAWAIPDHPWVDETGSAAVRVAMTIIRSDAQRAVRVDVDDSATATRMSEAARLHADLTTDVDVATAAATALRSNQGMGSPGFKLHGAGFILGTEEARLILASDPTQAAVIRPYRHGRDLAQRPRNVYVIDFGVRDEKEARAFAVPFDIVRTRVKPHRDSNNDRSTREKWWKFGRNREDFRPALADLTRYIATPETSKHRYFIFLDSSVVPDNMLVCVASDAAYHLGVLSSQIHLSWALAAGGRLGVGNDPRYNKSFCFDPFPFPNPTDDERQRIAAIAERLDTHRKAALDRDEKITMTGMYNVVEKLRSGETLTAREREIHTIAACGVLKDIHDELEVAVADAYGWPWPMMKEEILDRLVALHDERVEEEKRGIMRWLRPDYQSPRFTRETETPRLELVQTAAEEHETTTLPPWPGSTIDQIAALQSLLARRAHTADEAARAFSGARRDIVARHLETLAIMGEARSGADGAYHMVNQAA